MNRQAGQSPYELISSENEGETILKVRRVTHCFGGNGKGAAVLRDVSFSMARGELHCLIGHSGCGKTTLLKILAGFIRPTQGSCLVEGRKITGPGRDRCVVFQEDALFPWLTVRENTAFGLEGRKLTRKERNREVDRFLDLVGLRGYGDYLPRELSGGMKQRVALARVLILSPLLLLMDEPFGALDAQTREKMQALLLSLQQERRQTILFITHDVREAVTLADRVLFLEPGTGRLKQDIPVPLPRPRNTDTKEFRACCSQLHDWLRGNLASRLHSQGHLE